MDIYELKVKALAELCIISCINSPSIINTLSIIPNLKLVSRGGDALNYYFNKIIPTHDWDFGIVTLRDDDFELNQEEFNLRVEITQTIGKFFATSLTEYFKNDIVNEDFEGLKFNYRCTSDRLSTVSCNIKVDGVVARYTIIDMFICDRVVSGALRHPLLGYVVRNSDHLKHKIPYDLPLTNIQALDTLPTYLKNPMLKETIILNKIETVVVDDVTGINYIAPGDLFNDTVRMVYRSIYDININVNKLARYMKKLSNLIDLFNQAGICADKTCEYDATAKILHRNTDNLNCDGIELKSDEAIKEFKFKKMTFLHNFGVYIPHIEKYMDIVSVKKFCEIEYVLRLP